MTTHDITETLNPQIKNLKPDFYYHLGLDSGMDLKTHFGDVKAVFMCGSPKRAGIIARRAVQMLEIKMPTGTKIRPVGKTERYHMYKVGPLIIVSHGMGKPTVSILLHEVTKLLAAAGVKNPVYVRIGTCGGLGLEPGTSVVSTGCVNGGLTSNFPLIIFGKTHYRPSGFDLKVVKEMYSCRGQLPVVTGVTMATDDFYEGQGRLDGAICEYTEKDKMEFLHKLKRMGITNIEMEGDQVGAFCTKLNIRSAMVCTVICNRLKGDQVPHSPATIEGWTCKTIDFALRYARKLCRMKPTINEDIEKLPYHLQSKL